MSLLITTAFILLAILCGISPVEAWPKKSAIRPPQVVTLSVAQSSEGVYRVEGAFEVEAPLEAVWEALADYDQIGKFVSTIRESRVTDRTPIALTLVQEAEIQVLMFSQKVSLVLEVREDFKKSIVFQDTLLKDFSKYEGSWRMEETGGKVHVRYGLHAKPRFEIPGFLGRLLFEGSASDLLKEVRIEILRRGLEAALPRK